MCSLWHEPRWAVVGESYPLGCAFSEDLSCHRFLSVCPDRRRRIYSSTHGVYTPACGLKHVYLTWSAPEYLFTMLTLNNCPLPQDALALIRYQRFDSLVRHGAYTHLLSTQDRAMLPLLRRFARVLAAPEAARSALSSQESRMRDYQRLADKYLGAHALDW